MSAINAIRQSTIVADAPWVIKNILFWKAMQMLHFCHRIWKGYDRFQVYRNPDNYLKLAAGHTVNWLVGDYLVVRVAAHSLLVARRVVQCVQQMRFASRRSSRLWTVVKGEGSLPVRYRACRGRCNQVLSPSTMAWLRLLKDQLLAYLGRILWNIGQLLKTIGVFIMRLLDAIDTCYLSRISPHESVGEFFVNWDEAMKALLENKEALLAGLEAHRKLIDALLAGIGSRYTVEDLSAVVAKAISAAGTVHGGLNAASEAVGEFGVDFGKRLLLHGAIGVGAEELIPAAWLPSPVSPLYARWEEKAKERYPPDARITQIV